MRSIRRSGHRARLAARERRQIAAIAAFIGGLHVLGWGTPIAIVGPAHLRLGTAAFGVGIGFTAYVLGVRHAFDADHIAAIDNTTRRLMGRGEHPVSVGFWFALGHSTIVFALCVLIAAGARSLPHQLLDGRSGAPRGPRARRHRRVGLLPAGDRVRHLDRGAWALIGSVDLNTVAS